MSYKFNPIVSEFYEVATPGGPNTSIQFNNNGNFDGSEDLTFDGTNLIVGEEKNIQLGTVTGSKIGTATDQKLAFWNKTPVVQPTTDISEATFVVNSGGSIHPQSTFGGYTLAQIAQALINVGILA